MMKTAKIVGATIKRLRMKNNMSQQELASLLFVSSKTIGNWENGRRMPDILILSNIAKCLNVSPAIFLSDLENDTTPVTIIAIEDEPLILKGVTHILAESFPMANITGFSRASEALDFAKQNRIDVALIDIELRDSSGLTLARNLKSSQPHLNVIFVTGHPEYMKKAWEQHVSGYLLKPLTKKKIMNEFTNLRTSNSKIENMIASLQDNEG